ncbi:hypothetical protein BJ978_002779 [Agromyces terreus]|uniref:AbiEi antitoxin C-terminal domain-containing protein n=1 Tax=Agromyces terreus TaxID=424795 RepID=A0A9X2H357_9MICO|nr:hypothetical protein [Agromyces terreus]
MTRLPLALGTDDLSIAELCAARLDGDLHRVADAWVPIDEPDLPALRAQVIASGAPSDLVVERMSAAWVHGAVLAPPRRAQFCVPIDARVAIDASATFEFREVRIAGNEIELIGGVRCTNAVRTAYDLLRDASIDDAHAVKIVAHMLTQRADLAPSLHDRLDVARRIPHRALALRRLRSAVADAVDVVDGVDAAHGVQHAVQMGGVAHLEHEPADGEPIVRGRHVRREDVHVVL